MTPFFLLGWAIWGLLLVVAFIQWSEILFGLAGGRSTKRADLMRACVCTALICCFLAFPGWNKLHLFWLAPIIIVGGYWMDRQDARRRRQARLSRAEDVPMPDVVSQRASPSAPRPGPAPIALSVDIHRIVRAHVVLCDVDAGTYGVGWTLDDGTHGTDPVGTLAEAGAAVRSVSAAVVKRLPSSTIRRERYAQTGGTV